MGRWRKKPSGEDAATFAFLSSASARIRKYRAAFLDLKPISPGAVSGPALWASFADIIAELICQIAEELPAQARPHEYFLGSVATRAYEEGRYQWDQFESWRDLLEFLAVRMLVPPVKDYAYALFPSPERLTEILEEYLDVSDGSLEEAEVEQYFIQFLSNLDHAEQEALLAARSASGNLEKAASMLDLEIAELTVLLERLRQEWENFQRG